MTQSIVRIGNSVGVVIPKNLRANLKPGSKVTVKRKGGQIVVSPVRNKTVKGVDPKFMEMVDEFMKDHRDVLEELATR